MRKLADVFTAARLEVDPRPDGTAGLKRSEDGKRPFYEPINTSELAFYWLSLALQHACMEAFRRDADAVADGFQEAFKKSPDASGQADDEMAVDALLRRIRSSAAKGCRQARTCKAALKLKAEGGGQKKGAEL
eukprot:TRINITY_DN9321_c0_g3_i3.p1 TRINITY_DN9321_c0_g3~~TRINITY_DN9321_c0_g3_i3.p1  ORF type:complete len:133 (-),score=45.24 TRINITY_DN9321_c0_g3_i3:435-833(-)